MSNYIDLNTLGEMDAALLSDLNATTDSTLFPTNTRKMALNRAYRKCAALFRWPALEDSKKTSTGVGQYYYDAPTTWRPDSIWRVEVDGVPYGDAPDFRPTEFSDYLNWKSDAGNANSQEKKWATQWRRYFITPTPQTQGNKNICVWGQLNVTPLSSDSDVTIFSTNMPDCNEAIVLEAGAMLKKKGEAVDMGQMLSVEAKSILSIAYNKIKQERSRVEKIEPMFNVPNFFSGKGGRNHPQGGFDLG